VALEGRVVPSAMTSALTQLVAHERKLGVAVQSVGLSPAEIAQSNASDVPFANSTGDTIHMGLPVAEQVTTTYAVGTPQTETLLEVPDLPNNTITTYKTINLRNNGGTEKIVDTETFSGGTTPFSGTDNTHTITTTLPDGSIETETEHEVIDGHKTTINATLDEANGGIETWTSVNIRHGATTTANKTITEPDGTIEHQKTINTRYGDLDSTSKSTTTSPGSVQVSSSATNVIRVQPPSGWALT
jgi:hypothetical protein